MSKENLCALGMIFGLFIMINVLAFTEPTFIWTNAFLVGMVIFFWSCWKISED